MIHLNALSQTICQALVFRYNSLMGFLSDSKICISALGLVLLSSCSWTNAPPPSSPVSDIGGDPGAVAFEHMIELTWKKAELGLMNSLEIHYPSKITLIQTASTTDLSLQLQAFVEKAHHDEYTQTYLSRILTTSNLTSPDSILNIPAPEDACPQCACKETQTSQGAISSLQGICNHELALSMPTTHAISLNIACGGDLTANAISLPQLTLTLLDQTQTRISRLNGDLLASGGGMQTSIQIDGANNVELDLDSVAHADLRHISGHLHIDMNHPELLDPGAVTLDGKVITDFPFDSP